MTSTKHQLNPIKDQFAFFADIEAIKTSYEALDASLKPLEATLGFAHESPLGNAVWGVLERLVRVVGERWDCLDDLQYWYWEVLLNDREGLVCVDGRSYRLTKNPKSLWRLVRDNP